MAEIRNYKQDIEIDETDLEGEWLTHSSLYLHYSSLLAESIRNRDDAKLKMEWIAANIDLDIRKTWDTDEGYKKYGFKSKPAEGAIKSTFMTNKKYVKAYRKYNKCVKIVNSMTGVKTAFEHRKHALANIVSLRITGIHSEPRNKVRDLQKAVNIQEHHKRREALNKRMKNRKLRNMKDGQK